MAYTYKYPRPMVTVDAVIFGKCSDGSFEVLLIERGSPPFKGRWALPGGFIGMDESLDASIVRELKEETGIGSIKLRQFYAFGDPRRDPRGRNISVAYWGKELKSRLEPKAGSDAKSYKWFRLDSLPPLAFDHNEVIAKAIKAAKINLHVF